MYKNKYIIVVIIFFLALIIYFNIDSPSRREVFSSSNTPDFENNNNQIASIRNDSSQPIYIKYHSCKDVLETSNKIQKNWKKSSNSFIEKYKKKYNTNTILFALTLLDGDFFAYRKREIARKKDKNLVRRKEKSSILFSEIGIFSNDALSLTYSVENLLALFNMDVEDRRNTIDKKGLLINEVNDAIKSGKFVDEQVIELMSYLVDINGIATNVANFRADTLLDAIVDSSNNNLLEAYLEFGGLLIPNEFGSNSLERLLSKMQLEDIEQSKPIIEKLILNNFPLRVSKEQWMIGGYWKTPILYPKDFNQIVIDLSLRLKPPPKIEALHDKEEVMELLTLLRKDKMASTKETRGTTTFREINECKQIEEAVLTLNTKYSYQEQLNEAKKLFGDDEELLINYLFDLDSELAGCHSSRLKAYERTILANEKDFNKIFRLLYYKKGSVDEATEEVNQLNWNQNSKSFLFWQLIESKPELAGELIQKGFKPHKFDYYFASNLDAKSFDKIYNLGFSFDYPSPNNESLVEFASKSCNVELISYLADKSVNYSFGYKGFDALDFALSSYCRKNSDKVELIKAIMKFSPTIEKRHENSIAKLRLREFDSYQKLIKLFPQLSVRSDLEPYNISCR